MEADPSQSTDYIERMRGYEKRPAETEERHGTTDRNSDFIEEEEEERQLGNETAEVSQDEGEQREKHSRLGDIDCKKRVNAHQNESQRLDIEQVTEKERISRETSLGEASCSIQDKCVITAEPESGQQLMMLGQLQTSGESATVRQEYVLLFEGESGTEPMEAYVVEDDMDSPVASSERSVVAAEEADTGTEVEGEPNEGDKPIAVRIDGRVHFRCNECDYVSRRRNYIKVHKQKVHVAPRALPCHVCQLSFLSTAALYSHMAEMHSAELPFACDQCGYRARARHRIASHQFSHDKEPRYKCTKCGFATRHKYLYTQHEFTHQEPLPFSCSLCDYKAKWRSSVYMHIKKRHGERLVEDESWHEERPDEAT